MAQKRRYARPYAKAAFHTALKSDSMTKWHHFLDVTSTCISNPAVNKMLKNPGIKDSQIAAIIAGSLQTEAPAEALSLLALLGKNRRLALLPDISDLFEEAQRQHEQRMIATLYTARPIADETIVKSIEKKLQAQHGQHIQLQIEIDPTLIGGAKICIGDLVYDGSILGSVERLKQNLLG